MEKYDKYVAALMHKETIDEKEGIFSFKIVDMLVDGELNTTRDEFIDHKTGKAYLAMEEDILSFSEVNYCYAFPISKVDLKNEYKHLKKEKERIRQYYKELNQYIYMAVLNAENKTMKIVQIAKEDLKKAKQKVDPSEFGVAYDMDCDREFVLIPSELLPEIIRKIENKNFKELKDYFVMIQDSVQREKISLKQDAQNFFGGTKIEETGAVKAEESFGVEFANAQEKQKDLSVKELYEETKKIVIGQDATIRKVLSAFEVDKYAGADPSQKNRCLIVGKTGCGKTEIIRAIGKLINCPFVRTDSTQITVAGYIGGSIENNILVPLIQMTQGNIELAQRGIVALDEIDKKGSSANEDVAGRGVLNSFLPFLDGTQYPLTINGKKVMFDTSNLTICALGAFTNVFEYGGKSNRIGFQKNEKERKDEITVEDFIKIGLMPDEFMGRFPVVAVMNELTLTDFEKILTESSTSPLLFYENLFRENYHISLKYDSKFINLLAKKALEHKLGARALKRIIEETVEECRWEIFTNPNQYKELVLTEKTVENPTQYSLK